jgi:formate dehydrogenase alpha subunit
VAGLAIAFGSGAMTNTIEEIGDASTILAVGTNTTAAHPIVALRVKDAVKKGAKLIVANPKEIDLCRYADLFIQHKAGTDVALLMGMARVILDEGLQDQSFIDERCEDVEAFKASLENFDLDTVEEITGVPREKIIEAARLYATQKPSSILYCMGITQHVHGTDNVLSIANLASITGNLGKPSTGVNPLRGQSNVQGACDMGALPNVYPGYQQVVDPAVKDKFESAWGTSLDPSAGLTHTEIFDAVHDGKIKSLYLVGENPLLTEANSSHAKEALEKADFLVVQDIFLHETAELADVVLPASSFAEKDGTFTNTERRVQRVRKAIDPVGESKPDWWIISQIAKRLGAEGFEFTHPEQIMEEISGLVPAYGGISYSRLEKAGLQWPCPTSDHPGTPILHVDQASTKTGKCKLVPLEFKGPAEKTDADFPLLLTTDRSLYHYHGTMTRRAYGLDELHGEEKIKINPDDADNLGFADGDMIVVSSRRGRVEAKVNVTDICPPGTVSMTFHFSETPTNVLTCSEIDPVAKTPATKVCAVRLESMPS